nr:MAG TPA: hypothetical protein [Caudoviricetes sp.]
MCLQIYSTGQINKSMTKRILRELANRRRLAAINHFFESIQKDDTKEIKKERKYFICYNSMGGYDPQINLNRHTCDTFFVVEDGKIVDGAVKCKYGYLPFKSWRFEALLQEGKEINEATWRKWLNE